jgi:predicted transposase YbfD/YdcC
LRHKLADIVVTGFTTILCGYGGVDQMEWFGKLKEEWFKGLLELPHGIPDEETFRRLFERLDPKELYKCLETWLVEIKEEQKESGRAVNIDGKTIRGSKKGEKHAIHVVHAWISEHNLVLGQLATDEKSNEITAVPELIDLIDVRGAVVTADAMSCQKAIVKKIAEKEGDYILAVKENQPTLFSNIKEYFEGMEGGEIPEIPEDVWQPPEERGHGRIERREVRTVTDVDCVESKDSWQNLQTIIQYRTIRTEKDKTVQTDSYYISSANFYAEEFGKYIRGHWSSENKLHWCLDVAFREDACRARKNNSPLNLNILRKIALNRLRAINTERKRFSIRRRMMSASLDSDFLYAALFGE